MLLVKTILKTSTIPSAGIGCFADEFIPKDTIIWKLNPEIDRVFTQEQLDALESLERLFVITYAFRQGGLYYLCVDNGRFFNHTDEFASTYESRTEQITYAARDIQQGEEILSDYNTFGDNEADHQFNLNFYTK